MKRLLLYICLSLMCSVAEAAKITVTWQNPTQNTDGSALTNLSSIIIEWGTCNGTAFGTMKGSSLIATDVVGASMKAFIYPTGLAKVCIRAQALAANGAFSDYSNVAIKDLLPSPGKPVTLGQPVIISFNQPGDR